MKRKTLSLLSGALIAGSLLSSMAFAIPPPVGKKGDANGDGKVDIRDAQAILLVLVGRTKATPQMTANGDINGPGGKPNGKLGIEDALQITRIAAGLAKLP